MRRFLLTLAAACVLGGAALPAVAQGAGEAWEHPEPWEYRIEEASLALSSTHAGAHPDFTVSFRFSENSEGVAFSATRDVIAGLPPGIFGNPAVYPTCTAQQLGAEPQESECPLDAQVGIATIDNGPLSQFVNEPIYNMKVIGAGAAARFGFFAGGYPVYLNARLDPVTNSLIVSSEGTTSAETLTGVSTTFWGVPSSPIHSFERRTPQEVEESKAPPSGGRQSSLPEVPFMTNPTNCEAGHSVNLTARSYQLPASPSVKVIPFPAMTGCSSLGFNPSIAVRPTTTQGTSGSGLDFEIAFPTTGLEVPNLNYGAEAKRIEVSLPEGMTINPSEAEGLGVCSEADLARETYDSVPNQGCPEASKIGSVVAQSPVIDEPAEGALFLAKPYENPFGSFLALYIVLRIPSRGVLVKLSGEVKLDPRTGQITTVVDNAPQLPVASFHLHFREGARAPLVTPTACGTHQVVSNVSSWAMPANITQLTNDFVTDSGPDHGPCPSGGLPPFHPVLTAGTINNAAGSYSPFDIRISRSDSEQEITHFSIKLPPGVTGKLAGIPFCSDAAVAAAKARERQPRSGQEELEHPSCPQASEIGHTLVGAGVGSVLTYVPGKVYLAGPYHGSNLSIVAITAAKAGPFDLGTVVIREGLKVDPVTAEVSVDAAGSDPIPHIIAGIPVHLRDLRVYVDRDAFMKNPTNCTPTSTASTVLGAGNDFASEADDRPVTVTSRFQAADCASLGFRPNLKITLKGKTKRAGLPALTAVVTPRAGDANIGRAVVTLPKSEFLEQGHIGNSCTRVQFNSGAGGGAGCPANSVLGHAVAITPLLDEPLEGPVFLRSNGGERKLPDLVAALHSKDIDIVLVGFISSLHKKGSDVSQIRTTFASVPDQPVTKFTLKMFGGKKGLLVNSTNLCKGTHRALSTFVGQNGKRYESQPAVKASCKKHKKSKKKKSKGHGKAGSGAARAILRRAGW